MSVRILPILGKLAEKAGYENEQSAPQIILSKSCQNYLGALTKRLGTKRMTLEDEYFLKYSGHITNELGYYQNCALSSNVTFHTCQVGVEVLRDTVGICLAKDCSNQDWQSLQDGFYTLLTTSLEQQGPPKSLQADYMVAYFNQVLPSPIERPLADSYTMAIVSLVCFTILATIYSTIKGKINLENKSRKSTKENSKESGEDQSGLDEEYWHIRSSRYLDFFDLGLAIDRVKEYKVRSAGQLTCDLMRIVFVITTFMFVVPFSHGLVSKMTTDAVTNAYYNSPSGGRISQLIYFFPEGFLLISGYVCTLAVVRAVHRWRHSVSQSPFSFALLFALLLLKRFLKLAFAIGFGMVLVWKVLPLVATGPLSTSNLGCTDQNFFESLVFWNNNIGGTDRMCGIWYWFYAVNMRLYFFLPPIVFLSLKSKKLALALALIISVASFVINFAFNQTNKITELHPNSGLWIVKVLGCARFHGLSYFLGVAWGLSDPFNPEKPSQSTCSSPRSLSDEEWIPGRVAPVAQTSAMKHPLAVRTSTGISSRSTHTTMISAAHQNPAHTDEKAAAHSAKNLRNALNLKKAVLGGVCFAIWLVTYLIYSFIFQNDNVKIQDWPQWRHSLFNSLGIPIIGAMTVPAVHAVVSIYLKTFSRELSKNVVLFSLLSRLYFSLNVLGVPLILWLHFSLSNLPYFDTNLVNNSVVWENVVMIVVSLLFYQLVFRPLTFCINKLVKI